MNVSHENSIAIKVEIIYPVIIVHYLMLLYANTLSVLVKVESYRSGVRG